MNKLEYEIRNTNAGLATVVALACLTLNFSVWCAVKSPVIVLSFLSCKISVLPTWLFGLFDFLSFASLGFSLGAALGTACSASEVSKYRGAFYFVIGITLACAYHLFFFKLSSFLLSFLCAVLQCVCLFVATANFYKVSAISFFASVIGTLWSVYLLFFSFFATFCT